MKQTFARSFWQALGVRRGNQPSGRLRQQWFEYSVEQLRRWIGRDFEWRVGHVKQAT